MEKFVKKNNESKPLVFIIDELDRCRPNYAVEVLEQMKHFFAVPGIVFVLSIDKNHLASSVKGYYGSENINTDEYLRRFIDLEYSIPEPEEGAYYKYLYEYFKFDDFFTSPPRKSDFSHESNVGDFFKICKILFKNTQIPLRQQEKIFAHTRIALKGFNTNSYLSPILLIFLVFLKFRENVFYEEIKNKKIGLKELQEKLFILIENNYNPDEGINFILIEASLVSAYNSYLYGRFNTNKLFGKGEETNKDQLFLETSFGKEKNEDFLHILKNLSTSSSIHDVDFSSFFNRIELLECFKS